MGYVIRFYSPIALEKREQETGISRKRIHFDVVQCARFMNKVVLMKINRILLAMVLLGTIFMLPTGGAIAAGSTGTVHSTSLFTTADFSAEPAECELLSVINAYRKKNGRSALTISLTLSGAAEHHSADMATNNYFSHTLYDGSTWAANIAAHGYPKNTSRAENIAAGRETAAGVFEQWRNSSGHNANMLGSKYRAIGIGRVKNSDSTYTWYWTNTYGSTVDKPYTCPEKSSASVESSLLSFRGGGRSASSTSSLQAFDGDLETSWYTTTSSTPRNGYVYFDLGSSVYISKIMWYFNQGGASDLFEIQVSNDKSHWSTLISRETTNAGSWQSLKVGDRARYVRFYFYNPNQDGVLGYLAEVKVYS